MYTPIERCPFDSLFSVLVGGITTTVGIFFNLISPFQNQHRFVIANLNLFDNFKEFADIFIGRRS
jgi:hypothetical protein